MISQIAFFLLFASMAFFIRRRVLVISRNIRLGRDIQIDDQKPERWKNMLLMALGQKKMFDRPIVGIMHLLIYAGFFLINIEVLEIVLDGLLGTHRVFLPLFGETFYSFLINFFEVLAFLVVVGPM